MENAINTLRIQNFKSIKDVTMKPRRVNLIIGQPNVGKSNVLEAMSLLGSMVFEKEGKFLSSFIRYEEPRQIFYDNLMNNVIKIESDKSISIIGKKNNSSDFVYINSSKETYEKIIENASHKSKGSYIFGDETRLILDDFKHVLDRWDETYTPSGLAYMYAEFDKNGYFGGKLTHDVFRSVSSYVIKIPYRSYVFNKFISFNENFSNVFLRPPYGDNLIDVIQSFPLFRKEVGGLFEPYGLKLLIRIDERRLEVIKDLDGVIYSYPYSSIADTLQRIIFYLAAIESNDDAVILLEEPEAHSYPVYVSMLGRRMVESRNNQFFVATHSPYLITEVLEQMLPDEQQAAELAIFVAYYEDYQTKVKQLSDEEVRAIRNDGLDVFYNMDRYIPRPVNG